MWVDFGIWSSFVWEDVVDGAEGDHDQGEGGAGGVELPIVVILAKIWLDGGGVLDSISSYDFTSMRNYFAG